MMMKRFLLVVLGILLIQSLFADIPAGYYDGATGDGYTLKTQLYNIINDHTSVSYTPGVWNAIYTTDKKANGYVWDMYSDVPGGSPAYDYTLGDDQCGNYSGEGSCYNREHSFPKSWFNDASPMYTELFHLYPTDGYVNGKRSNYPFGEVGSASWTSTNGSKLGTSDYPGYSGTVFEPIDEYKGDFARTYFYMATRYENIIAGWENNNSNGDAVLNGTSDQVYEEWYLNLIIDWHNNDPVSQKELDRNDAVYAIQDNRNPFIDHPEYVAQIWGGEVSNNPPSVTDVTNSPTNPSSSETVNITATITDSDGTITNAELHWGLSSGSLSSTIIMSVSTGDTYTSNSDIPAQTDGITVYYEIEAIDDSSDVTTTSVHTYIVDNNPSITILSEDFTTCPASEWTTYSVAGSENWECGTNDMQVNAYDSDLACDDWLISPVLDLDSYDNEVLTFTSFTKYNDTYYPTIEVKYSTDYSGSGNPSSASWTDLTATWSAENSEAWTGSGDIDLSSITGNTVYIAFQYTSSGTESGTSALWEIDDVLVKGIESTSTNEAPVITDISNLPVSPTEEEDVTISATITDSDGTISSANIKWGTSSGSYTQTVSMTNTGDTYSGVIPAQSGGTIVYYIIEATDDEPETTQSGENSFSFTAIPNELPEISGISIDPVSPTEEDDVTVSATITDSDGTISSANIKWGTSSGNYTQTVSMTNTSGDTYSGTIPSQSAGTTIYYIIEATDDEPETTQSGENSFSFTAIPNELPEISGISIDPTSPTEEDDVTVSATITDSDGTIASANIKWGTTSGSYPNTVSMTNTGDTYSGVIPAQLGGTTVYYIIEATDDEPETTQSGENSFSFSTVGNIFPEISNVNFNPTNPESTESVSVSATITDSDGTIVTAKIKWGLSTGNYTNNVSMSADGNTYSGSIPAQADEAHVYFVVYTVDNDGGSAQSSEHDYIVDNTNALPEITNINFSPTDPESTESVSVSATITDSDGTISTAKIKWGTSSGSYPNMVSMDNSGSSYTGDISAQANGTNVFFIVECEDNEGGLSLSTELHYTVEDPVNQAPEISDVLINPVTPTEDDNVTVSAIVNDSDGTIESVVLKWKRGAGTYTDVNMNLSGDKYYGQISKQETGETIYFSIIARDNEGLEGSYTDGSYEISESSGVNDLLENNLIIYPNPTKDKINIEIDGSDQINSIKIYNLIGEKVLEINDLNTFIYTVELDIYPKGIYILQIDNSQNTIVRKIMLK